MTDSVRTVLNDTKGVIAESVYILYSSIIMNKTYNVQYGGIVNAFWIKVFIAIDQLSWYWNCI